MKTTYSTRIVGTSPLRETLQSIGRDTAKSKEKTKKKVYIHYAQHKNHQSITNKKCRKQQTEPQQKKQTLKFHICQKSRL